MILPVRFLHLFRSLRHCNFRLFAIGHGLSLIGTWMQMTAVAWLVWRLDHSAMLLGVVGFAARIPTFLLAPIGGVLADRFTQQRLIIATQALSLVQALALAGLMFSGHIQVWHVIVLSLVLGVIQAVDIPTRQAFLIHMIDDPHDLHNAIGLNSSMVNGARLVGPSVAGVLIALWGEAVCFLINGLSYFAVIASLLLMRVPGRQRVAGGPALLAHLAEGFRYAFGFAPIRALLLLLALVSLVGSSYGQLLPIFAERILGGDSRTQGFLISGAAVGALIGALHLASRPSVRGLGRVIAWSPAVMGGGLIVLGLSSWFWLTLAAMPVIGLGMMLQMASTNTVLQTIVDDDKRGRVMSFYSMSFMGMVPLGSLLAGAVAQLVGARAMVICGGACCILGALGFATRLPDLRRLIRPIYIQKGIIPSPAEPAGLGVAEAPAPAPTQSS
ncbi:MAG: enterobactin exporter EntS [candidate division BRC1 bacterium ADurb.BinA292]|nr:MAG: enterobactin exporter EntS [candidate division BRC1 bacterium ADurb.BinA292]